MARAGLAFLVLGALLALALRHAQPLLDDFLFLALGRHLANPWPLLTGDSAGTYFFRPATIGAWWLSVQLFGSEGPVQSAVNVALHGSSGALLALLIARLGLGAGAAMLGGLLFVAHPAAFATAAWLAARFDLVATFLGLGALLVLEGALRRNSRGALAAAVALFVLAMHGKEVAVAFVVAGATLALVDVPRGGAVAARTRFAWALAVLAVLPAAFAIRAAVLGDASLAAFGPDPAARVWEGASRFARSLPGFVVVDLGQPWATTAFAGTLAALVIGGAWMTAREGATPARRATAGGGILVAIIAVAVQSPVMAISDLGPFAGSFALEPFAASRFHYVPLAGACALLAALADPVLRPGARHATAARLAALVAIVAAGVTSATVARGWTSYGALADGGVRQAALRVALQVPAGAEPCKLYFLGTPPERYAPRLFLDVAVKAALPAGHPAVRCFLLAEHAPWHHLVPEGSLAARSPLVDAATTRPPLGLGGMALAFPAVRDGAAVVADPAARFFHWRGDRFVEITTEVRDGRIRPAFHDRR